MITSNLIPVDVSSTGDLAVEETTEFAEVTLTSLNITEAKLEEFVRLNVSSLLPDNDSLLIVGQQIRNQQGGRADLVAVAGDGSIVLIELKRDKDDILTRREPFEFQALRYAANYARIATPQELVQKLYAPYIERHPQEYSDLTSLTPSELATRILRKFLEANQSERSFNQRQRIVLMAASFDEQTLSACAWIAKGGIDIRCLSIAPIKYKNNYILTVEQIIPPPALDGYFVEIADSTSPSQSKNSVADGNKKQYLPRMPRLLDWGLVAIGDELCIANYPNSKATIHDADNVQFQGHLKTNGVWGREVTGWSAINIYEWFVHIKTGKTLDALRREKLKELEADTLLDDPQT